MEKIEYRLTFLEKDKTWAILDKDNNVIAAKNYYPGTPTFDTPQEIEDVEGLAKEYCKCGTHSSIETVFAKEDFKIGYNKAKETYKWTDEDMIDFHNFIFRHENQGKFMGDYLTEFKELSKPKEYHVELEMENGQPKITDNKVTIKNLKQL